MKSQATKAAIQEQNIALLAKQVAALAEEVRVGFKGVHDRQDTTNGRISKGETEVALIKQQMANEKILAEERGTSRVRVWQVVAFLGPVIVTLATYIIFNR